MGLLHLGNGFFLICERFLEKLHFLVRGYLQICVARVLCGIQVLSVIEIFDAGGWRICRYTASYELSDFLRSCLVTSHAILTSKEENPFLGDLRNSFDDITLTIFAQCVVVPVVCVLKVKNPLTCLQLLLGVDLVTEGKDDAQVVELQLRNCMLEDCQTVGVCCIRSRLLLENKDG